MRLLTSLREAYDNASLQRKIALVMGIGGLLVTGSIALAAFLLSRHLIINNVQSTLAMHALQQEREITLRLDTAVAQARALASNTVTANALADTVGRSTYLGPLFSGQSLPFPEASLFLTDYRGRVVASNKTLDPFEQSLLSGEDFARTMAGTQPLVRLLPANAETGARLIVAFPVIYRLTGQSEGCVLLAIPMDALLPNVTPKHRHALLDREDHVLAGHGHRNGPAIEAVATLQLAPPLEHLELRTQVSQDRATALHELDGLLIVFLLIGALLLMAVTVFSRAAARLLSQPMRELAAAADRIRESGRPDITLEVQREDEFGRLARAFSTMLARLSESYRELEFRVEERTQALQASEQKLSSILASLTDVVWSLSPDGTRLVYVSAALDEVTGIPTEAVSPDLRNLFAGIHPEELPVVREAIDHLARTGERIDLEFRYSHPRKGKRMLQVRGHAVHDASGATIRLDGTLSDVTQRWQAERRLYLRTDQLNAIFMLSPDGFVAFGEGGTIEYVSPALSEMTGLAPAELDGLTEAEWLDRLAGRCRSDSRTSQIALEQLRHPEPAIPRSGSPRLLLEIDGTQARTLEVGRRSQPGQRVSGIFYCRDVTHETEVDRLKSEFLSTAAHELRTPMVSILGFSELLLSHDSYDAATQRELIETIHRQSTLMAAIINELLDLARIEARRGQDFELEVLDLNTLATQAASALRMPQDNRQVEFLPAPHPCRVEADRRKLTQALNNVLSNAYKYSPAGGRITLTVCERPASAGQAAACGLQVRDHGIGMSAESLARVCERFFRADSSGRILGTGLGMSIVKEIIDLHGGELEMRSMLGEGTEITLWLPALDAPQASLNEARAA